MGQDFFWKTYVNLAFKESYQRITTLTLGFIFADFVEVNNVSADEPERVIQTLQLFPLNSFEEHEPKKLRMYANDCRETLHPPLDLRLSFL